MSTWGGYAEKYKGSGNGKFVKLKDGESITFGIMGEPGERHQLWERDGKKLEKPEDVSPGTPKAQITIGIPVYDVKQKAPRLLQLSTGTFRDLAELVGELGEDRVYRVSRKGAGLTDTKYTVTSIEKIDDALKQAMSRETPVGLEESGFSQVTVADETEREAGDESEKPDPNSIPF